MKQDENNGSGQSINPKIVENIKRNGLFDVMEAIIEGVPMNDIKFYMFDYDSSSTTKIEEEN